MEPVPRLATLERMSLDPTLLIRRWPERRAVVLTAAGLGFVAVLLAGGAGAHGLGALYVLPAMLAALELGLVGGVAASACAAAVALGSGAVAPAVAAMAVAAIAGRFSDRMHAAHAREQRLLESALALGELGAGDRLASTVAAAVLKAPTAVGVEVTLDGKPPVVSGRLAGALTATDIAARDRVLGRIVVAHRGRPEPEDRAALELLAAEVALAADNQRLLEQEREAAALEARLRRTHDELLEQRSGLGRVLAAHENERDRFADTLHEELAQVLAAVLLGLRMLRRQDSLDATTLDELDEQVLRALTDVRALAGELRPTPLAHLGLVPALDGLRESYETLSVVSDGVADPLPEPLRTGLYRLIESALRAARPAAPADVELRAAGEQLDVIVDVDLQGATEPLAAARARTALLDGTLRVEQLPDKRTRLRARLPIERGELLSARGQ